jgi:agmatinase
MKPYEGFSTFLKSSINNPAAYLGVLGLPFDGASSFRSGSRFGPRAIREASTMLTDGQHPLFEIDPAQHINDFGDLSLSQDVTRMLNQIEGHLIGHDFVMSDRPMVYLGGDHTVTLGILSALSTKGDLSVIHFDAHCDTWDTNFEDAIGHGTWVKNIVEEEIVDPRKIVQIGIRSPVDRVTRDYLKSKGGTVLSARETERLVSDSADQFAADIVKVIGKGPCYISFDIDCLDPAYAPGTGTPEIGGLSSMAVLEILEALMKKHHNWIGMDLVEVNPSFDHGQITSLAAATIIWTFASGYIKMRNSDV